MMMTRTWAVALLAAGVVCLCAQEPPTPPANPAAAIAGAKEDPAAVARGAKAFETYCAGCHGPSGRGGPGAPDLVRSLLVLDDEKGILIAPVIRDGRPDKGMPKLNLTEPQITDIVAWLHVQTYAAGHRTTYEFKDVLTGDPAKGKAYFNGAGGCSSCHSPTGDLAGGAGKNDPISLQSRWLLPRSPRRRGRGASNSAESSGTALTAKVTLPSGETVSGTVEHVDDFTISLRDSKNQYHSFTRNGDTPKVEVRDPIQAHTDLLRKYTDADIHNVTAYLATLK
jgi:mono/diheme cytochrome c family protein